MTPPQASEAAVGGRAYYNEHDPHAAAWLRELIARGLIAPGDVDERSIEDVKPGDLRGYRQVHLFAGIGGWSYALRLAGWPDDQPVWTCSCPCQPFSQAGAGAGFADERHLWPAAQHLIRQCGPAVVVGEQVASKDADAWIDLVHADLEGMGYAFGCVAFPSAGIGAPHIRDRIYWLADADADDAGREGWGVLSERAAERPAWARGLAGGMADADGRDASAEREQRGGQQRQQPAHGAVVRLADTDRERRNRVGLLLRPETDGRDEREILEAARRCEAGRPGPANGFWRSADWLGCTDGKWRPVEPGTFPLADGLPARVVRLRGYGNAINAEAAAEFIRAYQECRAVRLMEAA